MRNKPETGAEDKPEIKALRRKLKKQADETAKLKAAMAGTPPAQAAPFTPAPSAVPEKITYSRCVPASPAPSTTKKRDYGPSITLEEAVAGVTREASAGPGYYHIEKLAVEIEPGAAEVHQGFVPLLGNPNGSAVERIAAVCKKERIAPEDIVFLDLETTGLSMTPVFLIGTMEVASDGFRFTQYFARDYSEEASILAAFSERLKKARMVVTFNGKSFDVPFMQNRAIATGVKLATVHGHLDLLHEARRMFARKLPNCKLQTLERHVCGRSREDDIPGAEIPAAYHEFVRTGNANKIGPIIQHNLLDLLTMADLMRRMWGKG